MVDIKVIKAKGGLSGMWDVYANGVFILRERTRKKAEQTASNLRKKYA